MGFTEHTLPCEMGVRLRWLPRAALRSLGLLQHGRDATTVGKRPGKKPLRHLGAHLARPRHRELLDLHALAPNLARVPQAQCGRRTADGSRVRARLRSRAGRAQGPCECDPTTDRQARPQHGRGQPRGPAGQRERCRRLGETSAQQQAAAGRCARSGQRPMALPQRGHTDNPQRHMPRSGPH